MIPLKILNKKETDSVLNKLKNQFGIEKVPGRIFMKGKERMFLFSGDFIDSQIKELERNFIIERLGVYFAKLDERTGDLRLSLDGSQILKPSKNVFEVNSEQVEEWMKGRELNIESGMKGFVAIKYENEFLGTGKASEKKISNFIPKNRRLKEKS